MITGSQLIQENPIAEWSIFTKLHYALLQSTILGKEFVVLFFILSGFSIAHSIKLSPNWYDFYKRRLVRLYPSYILSLIWAFIVFRLCTSDGEFFQLSRSVFDDANFFFLNFLYIPNGDLIPQFWSLTHEVIFYILSPLILKNYQRTKIFIASTLILFITFAIITPLNPFTDIIIVNFLCDYAVFFAFGILLYHSTSSISKYKLLYHPVFAIATISILFILMIVVKFYLGLHNKFSLVLAVIFSLMLIINFLHHHLKCVILTRLGRMSYTLYITHFASIYFILFILSKAGIVGRHSIPNSWYLWMIGVIGCIILAIPFYFLAEKPTQQILKRTRKQT